jgi:4-hydroxy-tetrahydrodipicolinate synthase
MKARSLFHGSLVAMPTPFRDGGVDHAAFRRLTERQIAGGSDGLVVSGTTGESATLSAVERIALFEYAAGTVHGRVPVIAGVGSSDTRVACELARNAASVGADGLLVSTPSYSRPSQEGLRRHFGEIAAATELPLCLYNVPSRTAVDLLPATIAAIQAECPRVVAIKEAATSLARMKELVALGTLDVLAGEDAWIADGMQLGAVGVVGVVANLVPKEVATLVHAFDATDDPPQAPKLVEFLAPLIQALFLESNPAPLKAALARLGLCREDLRLPLVPVSDGTRKRIEGALSAGGLLG